MNQRLTFGSPIDGVLERLYGENAAQDGALESYFASHAAEPSFDWNNFDARPNEFLKDKLIALDRSAGQSSPGHAASA